VHPELTLTEGAAPAATRSNSDAIAVTGLRKSYGTVQAVRDVSFRVRSGEIVALLRGAPDDHHHARWPAAVSP
jgi:ATPase subunit of ABC transporter with duplicated ATPase domains